MSLAAASLSESCSESSEDPTVIQACARSFESIDSFSSGTFGNDSSTRLNESLGFRNASSRQSLDSLGSVDSLPRCYSIPNSEISEHGSLGRFSTWSKATFRKRYSPLLARSETNLFDLSPNTIRNAFRRTVRQKMSGKGALSTLSTGVEKRHFHSCNALDTVPDEHGDTVTAVVSRAGIQDGVVRSLSAFCESYPPVEGISSDALFVGHKQDFRSICWSQQRRKSGASFLTGTTTELRLSSTAEELRFEETENVSHPSTRSSRRLSDIGLFKEVTVKVRVPADVLCSKKGFGKEVVFTLPPTATIYTLVGEIEKFTKTYLRKYKLCPGLLLQDCIEFWRSSEDLNLHKELHFCTATEESPTLHFRLISKENTERTVKVTIALPPMVLSASYTPDHTTADLLSMIINSPKLNETDLKKRPQKFGLYHPRYKSFLMTDELVSFYDIAQGDVLELKARNRSVGGHSLYLHVHIPDEGRTVLVVINSDVTVAELISKILMEVESGTDTKWSYYGVYLPTSGDRHGGWMDDYKMLHSYPLQSVDKIELRSRFRMFIFDLQVYSTSQKFNRNFVNMYISDMITAGEVLRIITSTNCLDYPTSWYGVYLHDDEQISGSTRLCAALENKATSKQDSLVVHMVHQEIKVRLEEEEEGSEQAFSVDFSAPLRLLHSRLCRFYGVRVPVTCLIKHEDRQLDLSMCLIKNKVNPGDTIQMCFKKFQSPTSPPEAKPVGRGRVARVKNLSGETTQDLKSIKSVSDSDTPLPSPASTLSPSATSDPTSPTSPSQPTDRPTNGPVVNGSVQPATPPTHLTIPREEGEEEELGRTLAELSDGETSPASPVMDKVLASTRGESTQYECTNKVECDGLASLSGGVAPPSPTSPPPPDEGVLLRKPVDRIKRAQSKIYEDDDVNIWDDESNVADTLVYESNGQVKSGTFNRFVELLTDTSNYKINFVKVFLLTYQAFTTPKQLLRKLIQRYNVPRTPGTTLAEFVRYRTGIQNGVINCLKLWVSDGDDFKASPQLQKEFMTFIRTCVYPDNPQQYRILRQKLLVVKGTVLTPIVQTPIETPPLKLPPNLSPNATLFDHGAPEIARQLTMLDFALFARIKPLELVNQAWVKPKYSHQAKNILQYAERMNTLTRWAATSILAQKGKSERARLISELINIADELYKLNNFSSFIAVINALEGSAISRLQSSWNKVDRKVCGRLDELYDLIIPNNNFRTLRKILSEADPPCIPYVGLFMSDLTFVSECNPTVLNGMINFVKCTQINNIINRLRLYQQQPYHFEVVPSIVAPLQQLIALDEETLYEMSIQIEPKKSK